MLNLYRAFLDLIPSPALEVGVVESVAHSVAVVLMPGGGRIKARGSAAVGQTVFVRNGVIEGPAPALPVELIDI